MNNQRSGANVVFGCEYIALFKLFLLRGIHRNVLNIRIYSHRRQTFAPGKGETAGGSRMRISGRNALNPSNPVTKVNNLGNKAGKLPPIYGPRIQQTPTYGGIQREVKWT